MPLAAEGRLFEAPPLRMYLAPSLNDIIHFGGFADPPLNHTRLYFGSSPPPSPVPKRYLIYDRTGGRSRVKLHQVDFLSPFNFCEGYLLLLLLQGGNKVNSVGGGDLGFYLGGCLERFRWFPKFYPALSLEVS